MYAMLTDDQIKSMSDEDMDKYIKELTQRNNDLNLIKKLKAEAEELEGIHQEAQEWKPDLSSDIDYVIPFTGLARDIQQWILETSIKPQPALALASTLCILGTVFGRSMQVNGIKGNMLTLCFAESGEGKDWPLKACQKILDSIGMADHNYSDMASGAALIDAIEKTPNAMLTIDEAGHYFSSINSRNASQYSREIMPAITKLYTSASDFYIDKKRKGQDVRKIIEPNLSVLAMSTERQTMEALRSSEVADGSLARFLVVFGRNDVPINRNRKTNDNVPGSIKTQLETLKSSNFLLASREIDLEDSYKKAKQDMEDRFNELAIKIGNDGGEKSYFKPFYYRLSFRAMQMALLLDQCYNLDILYWCSGIAEKSCNNFIKKFLHLSADNETERYVKIVQRAIKEAGKHGITKGRLYDKTRQVDPSLKKRIMEDLIDSGKIFLEEKFIGHSQKRSTMYFWRK